jgi:hypothetical protein
LFGSMPSRRSSPMPLVRAACTAARMIAQRVAGVVARATASSISWRVKERMTL